MSQPLNTCPCSPGKQFTSNPKYGPHSKTNKHKNYLLNQNRISSRNQRQINNAQSGHQQVMQEIKQKEKSRKITLDKANIRKLDQSGIDVLWKMYDRISELEFKVEEQSIKIKDNETEIEYIKDNYQYVPDSGW